MEKRSTTITLLNIIITKSMRMLKMIDSIIIIIEYKITKVAKLKRDQGLMQLKTQRGFST